MATYIDKIRLNFEIYKKKVIVHNDKDILFVASNFIEANQWGRNNYGIEWDKLHYFYVPSKFNKLRILTLKIKNLLIKEWMPNFPVKFWGEGDQPIEMEMLVDSGADITVLSYQSGIDIGFRRSLGDKIEQAEGVGGDVPYIVKQINVEIAQHFLLITVGWCLDESIDDMLLGRQDVFDFFNVEFQQTAGQIIFTPVTNLEMA